MAREILDPIAVDRVISQGVKTDRFDVLINQIGKQNRIVAPTVKVNVKRANIGTVVENINVLGFGENEVFERFNESSPYWNTRRGQSFLRITHRRLSNSKRSEIDLNLDLVSKYQRESQDKKLEKILAQIDIDLLNSKLSKGLLFKEKITSSSIKRQHSSIHICVNIFLSFIIVLNFRRGILSYPHLKEFKF